MANLIYNRKSEPTRVHHTELKYGSFYRAADAKGLEPNIYLATDERQVVALHSGVQFPAHVHDDYVEVDVSITVGADA